VPKTKSKRGRKPIPASKRRVRLAVRVDPESIRKLKFLAKERKVSMGKVVDSLFERLRLG